MTLQTRPPTGLDPWPLTLMTGTRKSGKTHQAAAASASPLIDRTFWFTYGEPQPDGFSTIDTGIGAPTRFEIVYYDGTIPGLVGAMQDAAAVENPTPGRPHLWVLDSGTKVWETIKDMAQATADRRWLNRDTNKGKELPEGGAVISGDLWNLARDRWNRIVNMMLEHNGPSIITARLDNVNAVNTKGDPTGEKIWKIQSHKTLPFECDAIVELMGRDQINITGVRSSRFNGQPGDVTRFPDFTMDAFWRKLGFADSAAGVRDYVTSTGAESQDRDEFIVTRREALLAELMEIATHYRFHVSYIAQDWAKTYKHPIEQTSDIGALELFRDDVVSRLKARAEANQQKGNAA